MENEEKIIEITRNLPSTIEELVDFVIVGNEAIKSFKAKLKAIEKVDKASEAWKQSLLDGQKVGECVISAESRLGELLSPEKRGGTYQSSSDGTLKHGTKTSLPIGINKKMSHYAQEIYNNPDVVTEVISESIDKKTIPTPIEVLKKIKNKKKKQKIEEQKKEIEKGLKDLKGFFDIIVIDPPWKYNRKYDANSSRVASPYPEMSFDELKQIKLPSKDDCILWCWTTDQFIWDAKKLLDIWGFNYKCIMVWDKEKIGIGNWLRLQCEFCLLGIKGKPLWESKDIRDIIRESRTQHSVKPEAFYKMIDNNFVGKKLDYFGRKKRKGWVIYGAGQNNL